MKKLVSNVVFATVAVLGCGAVAADEAAAPAAAPAPPAWSISTNLNLVSDYYFRGISQTWHEPAVQGGADLSTASGWYAGTWFSNITGNSYNQGTLEWDYYAGYSGPIPGLSDDFSWTAGFYGYYYPGAHYAGSSEDYDSIEANVGASWKWISLKSSFMLTDWYGANTKTGWTDSTDGSVYYEANISYPLDNLWDGLSFEGHVGHQHVSAKLSVAAGACGYTAIAAAKAAGTPVPDGECSADYTDYKVGLAKSFKIGSSDGWSVGAYVVGATNSDKREFWGRYGFSAGKDLGDTRGLLTIGRSF